MAETAAATKGKRLRCVAIVGVGMMGGSLGLALKERGLAARVLGIDRNADLLAAAVARGAIDAGSTDWQALEKAEIIVMAAPVGVIPALLQEMAPAVPASALITDLGSTKSQIVSAGEAIFGERFVGGHPMAGSEKSGVGAAQSRLFQGAAWGIVRSAPFTLENDLYASRLAAFAGGLGARPVPLDAPQHDRLVALVSHLPHILAFAFAHTASASPETEQAHRMAGSSFRDLMRLATSSPALWRDILFENREALLASLDAYETHLQHLKEALLAENSEDLFALLRNDISS